MHNCTNRNLHFFIIQNRKVLTFYKNTFYILKPMWANFTKLSRTEFQCHTIATLMTVY